MKKVIYFFVFAFLFHVSHASEILKQFTESDRLGFKKYMKEGKEEDLRKFFKEICNFSDSNVRLCIKQIRKDILKEGESEFMDVVTESSESIDVATELRKIYKIKPRK